MASMLPEATTVTAMGWSPREKMGLDGGVTRRQRGPRCAGHAVPGECVLRLSNLNGGTGSP
eukprot:2000429-Rhodomonas_salina.2